MRHFDRSSQQSFTLYKVGREKMLKCKMQKWNARHFYTWTWQKGLDRKHFQHLFARARSLSLSRWQQNKLVKQGNNCSRVQHIDHRANHSMCWDTIPLPLFFSLPHWRNNQRWRQTIYKCTREKKMVLLKIKVKLHTACNATIRHAKTSSLPVYSRLRVVETLPFNRLKCFIWRNVCS